jgi:response regulator RpfG family c-di-GMP phosphodiesterase
MNVLMLNLPDAVKPDAGRSRSSRYRVFQCKGAEDALETIEQEDIDLVLVYLRHLRHDTGEMIRAIMASYPEMRVVGIADDAVSGLLNFLEDVQLTPAHAGEGD